ncbi:MAG: hypothetical protein V3573_02845 [Desulfovibrionaceae bacterium]
MREIKEIQAAYTRALGTPDGRSVLADLERQGFLRDSVFCTDALEMAHNEGRRSMVLHVLRMIEAGKGQNATARREPNSGA